ncbi:thioredoxin domain-containing protein [Bacillus sp. 522_BSPC]|uniref:thioredoxin domain-containing protein n=1 Tax=Bacillus sp. 522_BSPC TaxID=1579338 RepID=UPI00066176ED|nr:thioredoxin domain-containing protein [Bacillus sp. 522_BSPC]
MKKKNRPMIIFIVIAVILIVCFAAIWLLNSNRINAIEDLTKIEASSTFNQQDEEYIVYFWQATCTYCKEIEEHVIEFSNSGDVPIYIVDMQEEKNEASWYDWEAHHKEHDKIIGKIVDGKEVWNDGINIEDFQNDKNIAWGVVANEDNQIIATHNTAYGNEAPETAKEIEITGTPTMIKIKNGIFEDYAVGVEETLDMLGK